MFIIRLDLTLVRLFEFLCIKFRSRPHVILKIYKVYPHASHDRGRPDKFFNGGAAVFCLADLIVHLFRVSRSRDVSGAGTSGAPPPSHFVLFLGRGGAVVNLECTTRINFILSSTYNVYNICKPICYTALSLKKQRVSVKVHQNSPQAPIIYRAGTAQGPRPGYGIPGSATEGNVCMFLKEWIVRACQMSPNHQRHQSPAYIISTR